MEFMKDISLNIFTYKGKINRIEFIAQFILMNSVPIILFVMLHKLYSFIASGPFIATHDIFFYFIVFSPTALESMNLILILILLIKRCRDIGINSMSLLFIYMSYFVFCSEFMYRLYLATDHPVLEGYLFYTQNDLMYFAGWIVSLLLSTAFFIPSDFLKKEVKNA